MSKKKLTILISGVLTAAFLITACGGSTPTGGTPTGSDMPSGSIQIQGSDTMVNLGQALAEVYMDDVNPSGNLAVTGGGSGTGIAAMINDNTDIAQSSRDMKEEELQNALDNGVTAVEFVVAQDGLAVVVNPANPIDQLTVTEIKDIFIGQISDWSELGWPEGGTITLYSRQSNSGTYVFFNENIMDGEDWAPDTMFMPGSAAIAEGVEADRSAIGYFGIGYVKEETNKALNVARTAGDEYITPHEKSNVDSGLYPISRPLFFYTNGTPTDLVRHYLDWVLSEHGQQVVADNGFYNLSPEYVTRNEEAFKAIGLR